MPTAQPHAMTPEVTEGNDVVLVIVLLDAACMAHAHTVQCLVLIHALPANLKQVLCSSTRKCAGSGAVLTVHLDNADSRRLLCLL